MLFRSGMKKGCIGVQLWTSTSRVTRSAATATARLSPGATLRGANCLGDEKIIRLRKVLPHNALWAVAYSDHRADLPLLLASRQRFVINPTQKNKAAISRVLGEEGYIELHWTPLNSKIIKS